MIPVEQARTAARLWAYVAPYRLHLLGTLLVCLAATPLTLLIPIPVKIAVDSVLGDIPAPKSITALVETFGGAPSSSNLLIVVALLIVVTTVLIYVQSLGAWVAQTWIGELLVLDLRASLLRHAQRLSLAYHDRTGTMDSVYRIQYDAQSLQHVFVTGLMPLATAALTLIGMVVVTAVIDRQLALVALCVCPILYGLTARFGQRMRARWYEVKDLDSSAMSVVQEALAAVRVVKAFGREEAEYDRFVRRSSERLSGQVGIAKLQGGFDLAIGVTIACGTALVLVVGVMHVKAGVLSVGQLLVVMAYITQIYEPLKTISKKMGDLQSGLVSAERAMTLLDEVPDVEEQPHAKTVRRVAGEFQFNNVSFHYEAERPILRDITLTVPAGSRVGLQGRTGAGKSTLISLLTRFYDPASGQILLDGVDLREYRLADLRNQFAIVLQEPVLFSTTIAENIAYGRPSATESEIIQAARNANAHDFISALPLGYRTEVGERGMCLSGGERQRVSIARAFLKNAPILLLDEPTSSVDLETETAIVEAMDRLMRGRTVFMIAHRLTTLQSCDIRLELSNGAITLLQPAASERCYSG